MKRVALVTGCDSPNGIGQAVCKELVTKGCIVYATGLSLEAMAPLHAFAPEQVRTIVMDVTKEKQVLEVISKVNQETDGRLDILVNNAGIASMGPTTEADLNVSRKVHEVNFWGTWAVCKAASKLMIQRRSGVIVNIGSFASRASPPFLAAYNTSKAAVESLSHSLRVELSPFRVSVVYIAPTWCRTAIFSAAHQPTEAEWRAGNYGAISADVVREGRAPEGPSAWPTSRMAKRIVSAAMKRRPPLYVYGGGEHRTLRFIVGWLPRRLVDLVLLHRTGLARLARLVKREAVAKK